MNAKSFVKTMCASALMLISSLTLSAENELQLFYNAEEVNGQKVAETIYKADGGLLANYMKYHYTYDEQNRLTMSEILVWNKHTKEWQKDLCMRYTYKDGNITTASYRWNQQKEEYVENLSAAIILSWRAKSSHLTKSTGTCLEIPRLRSG